MRRKGKLTYVLLGTCKKDITVKVAMEKGNQIKKGSVHKPHPKEYL